MIYPLKNWRVALLVFYLIVIAPSAFACNAILSDSESLGFKDRGLLGAAAEYTQRVYSGEMMSFSTIVYPKGKPLDASRALHDTARMIGSTVSAKTQSDPPKIKLLNNNLLSKLDERLAFLNYTDYRWGSGVNVEASALIKNNTCWALLRFSAVEKRNKEEALDVFASLIRNVFIGGMN